MNDDSKNNEHEDDFDPRKPTGQPLNVPSGPLPVREGCWMVGHRNPHSLLQCNTYVRSFEEGSTPASTSRTWPAAR